MNDRTNAELIQAARDWWAESMTTTLVSLAVKHDRYVRFEWRDDTESGSYHLPIDRLSP